MRLFAAIKLSEAAQDHLANTLALVSPPPAGRGQSRYPWVPGHNWHITLAFFGEQPNGIVDQLTAHLRAAASSTPPFDLALSEAGVFRHEVCWIGVRDRTGALGPLAEKVRQGYAGGDQHTRNKFHVTISRSKQRPDLQDAMSVLSVYRGPAWTVRQLSLFRSDLGEGVGGHPLYTELEEIRLG